MSTCAVCQADNPARAKFCSNCGTQLHPAGQSQRARKQVTVLFTDVVDSTALGRQLDNEPYGRVLERFFATARQVLERHGGVVQKYVGDAVMAVFGLPQVQEDDALRAVKAAVELHGEIKTLNAELLRDWGVELRVHTAISTGGVVVEEEETRELGVAADHINLVASLIKLAEADMILIDRTTHHQVRGMVRADAVHLPTAGDSGPVYNVLGLSEQPALPHRMVVPLIGRELELGWLRMSYEFVLRKRSCYLVSVLGAPGIGKTRLVEEFTRSLSRRDPDERPLVLRGLCVRPIPASTFYPMRQILRQAAGIRGDASEAVAVRQLDDWVEGDQPVVARLAAFLEVAGQMAEPEDTIRAICRALTIAARRGPLVLVVDDLHWAEQPMLDAILRIKESLSDVPVLLVAVSREVFFDETRDWGGWVRNTSSVTLEPLSRTETEQMIDQILLGGEPDTEVVQAIVRETGGTPLDVEALMANLTEDGVLRLEDRRWVLTEDLSVLRKLLRGGAAFAARLERLDQTQRRVIVRAALAGMEFRIAEVVALLPDLDSAAVTERLRSLVRRDLIKLMPETSGALEPGDETYTFRHANYQQAAYDRLTLEDRMVLHGQYASWLAEAGDDSPTTAERIGFHFRQSYEALVAFRGDGAEQAGELARRAGEWYARAGRGYITEATSPVRPVERVLDRAIRLLPDGSPEQLQARLDLADTLQEPDHKRAREIYAEVVDAARAIGNRPLQRHAELGRLEVVWYAGQMGDDYNKDRSWLEEAIQEFEALGDVTGWHLTAKAYRLQSQAYMAVGKTARSIDAADRALEKVRKTNDARLHAKIIGMKYVNEFWGPDPLDDIVQRIREAVRWAQQEGLFSLQALGLTLLARAAAMRGDFQRGRQFIQEARQVARRRTDLMTSPAEAISEGMVEMLAGNLEDAERIVRAGYETQVARGSVGHIAATTAAPLARILLLSGRDAEAAEAIKACRAGVHETQLDNQIKLRQLEAVLRAHRGELAEAEKLAREAVERSQQTEQPLTKAEALADLADILRQVGKTDEARSAAEQALRLYRGKGHMVAARETERLLDRIGDPPAASA